MKQHITETQLTELSASQFEKLTKYVTEKNLLPHFTGSQLVLHPASKYLADCMNIGQMIEFLSDTGNNFWISYDRNPMLWSYTKGKTPHPKDQNTVPEICDTLWEAVKEVLEKG